MKRIGHIIAGETITRGDEVAPVFNPATGEQTGEVLLGGADEIARAVDAAAAAQIAWGAAPPAKRAEVMFALRDVMRKRRDEVAETISAEHGKTHEDAVGEVTRGLEVVEFACGAPQLLKGEMTENVGTDFEMDAFQPQHAFGHGLSYSPVVTTGLTLLNEGDVHLGDELVVEATLHNTGDRTSTEVVMLFAQDRVASITPSEDKLKAYKRVFVDAGATKRVQLRVPTTDLGFIGQDLTYVVEPGVFGLRVQDQTLEFELKKIKTLDT